MDTGTKYLYASLVILAASIGPIITGLGLLLSPVGLVIAGLAVIVYVIVKQWDGLAPIIVSVTNSMIDLYNNSLLVRLGAELIYQSFKTAFEGISLVLSQVSSQFIAFWGGMIKAATGNISGAIVDFSIAGIAQEWLDFGKRLEKIGKKDSIKQ